MEKRYQVFVSSTYSDLIEERNEVMQALLELECMPAGMELFPAANETQWNWIKKVIDESDYYIVIIAGRYGTLSNETGISYTEMEYRYALEINKPIIGFIHQDIEQLPSKKCEQDQESIKKLNNFKQLVKSKLCKFYSSPEDLGSKVSRSIVQLKKQYPSVGWIRADAFKNFASSDELLDLMKENEELKKLITIYEKEKPKALSNLASGNDLYEIEYSFNIKANIPGTNSWKKVDEGKDCISLTWNEIFEIISWNLIKDTYHFSNPLEDYIKQTEKDKLNSKYPDKKIQDFRIHQRVMNAIYFQFRALKLMESKMNKWYLTTFGENYLSDLVGIKKK